MRLPLSIDSARKRVGEVRRQIEQGEWALAMAQMQLGRLGPKWCRGRSVGGSELAIMGIGRLAALFLGLLVFSCRSNPQVLASHVFYLGVKKAVFIVVDDLFEQSACVGCGLF